MEFFLEQIGVILPVLSFDFTQATAIPPTNTNPTATPPQVQFEMAAVGVGADAVEADSEFIVLKGSTARFGGTPSWTS
jgi:hypothetical protein